jgi:hypothetical protein
MILLSMLEAAMWLIIFFLILSQSKKVFLDTAIGSIVHELRKRRDVFWGIMAIGAFGMVALRIINTYIMMFPPAPAWADLIGLIEHLTLLLGGGAFMCLLHSYQIKN